MIKSVWLWSDEDDAALRRGAENGETYGSLARQLGVSRNAIAGRAHRLGLSFGKTAAQLLPIYRDNQRRSVEARLKNRRMGA